MLETVRFGCGTKQPILKRDKTADFQTETKQPIFKTGQNSQKSKKCILKKKNLRLEWLNFKVFIKNIM